MQNESSSIIRGHPYIMQFLMKDGGRTLEDYVVCKALLLSTEYRERTDYYYEEVVGRVSKNLNVDDVIRG